MTSRKCEICGFKSTRKDEKKRYFMAQFPLDELRCKQWVKVTGKEDLAYIPIEKLHQSKFVCGKHFTSKDFKKKRTQLKKYAVPSIRLTANPLSDDKLVEFPYYVFKEQQVATEDVPSTSSLADYIKITNENETAEDMSCQKLYSEHDIPPIEYTIEVHTSHQPIFEKDVPCSLSIPKTQKGLKNLKNQNKKIPFRETRKVVNKRRQTIQLSPRKKKLVRTSQVPMLLLVRIPNNNYKIIQY